MIGLREYTAIVGGIDKDVHTGIDRQVSAFREERVMATTWVSFKQIKWMSRSSGAAGA
jgi:hypothetical protein